jgi:hypothetical protein
VHLAFGVPPIVCSDIQMWLAAIRRIYPRSRVPALRSSIFRRTNGFPRIQVPSLNAVGCKALHITLVVRS